MALKKPPQPQAKQVAKATALDSAKQSAAENHVMKLNATAQEILLEVLHSRPVAAQYRIQRMDERRVIDALVQQGLIKSPELNYRATLLGLVALGNIHDTRPFLRDIEAMFKDMRGWYIAKKGLEDWTSVEAEKSCGWMTADQIYIATTFLSDAPVSIFRTFGRNPTAGFIRISLAENILDYKTFEDFMVAVKGAFVMLRSGNPELVYDVPPSREVVASFPAGISSSAPSINNSHRSPKPGTCFVVIASDRDGSKVHNHRYTKVIKPAIESCGYTPTRNVDGLHPNWFSEMIEHLRTCELAVVDLTDLRHNCIWELGILNAWNVPLVLIRQNDDRLQEFLSDIFTQRVSIFYKGRSGTEHKRLKKGLQEQIPEVMKHPDRGNFLPKSKSPR